MELATAAAETLPESEPIPSTLPDVDEARSRPGLGLAQIVDIVMTGYRPRPALGRRQREIVRDAETGRASVRLLPAYETISYGELWDRARSLASVWATDTGPRVGTGDFVCILAFAGVDYVTVDLAAISRGAVSVPVQTNASIPDLVGIVAETRPRVIAVSIENIETAVAILDEIDFGVDLVVLDFEEGDDDQRERLDTARARLSEQGAADRLHMLGDLCRMGAALPRPPLPVTAEEGETLSTIHYTSGSTGSPKGAMWPERMVAWAWRARPPAPVVCFNYMPMNHSFGRSQVFTALANGGSCHFAARSDLSTFFEDIRLVRPTQMALVPRVCELIHQRFLDESERRGADRSSELADEFRVSVFGGRMKLCGFGSAPLAPEVRDVVNRCLGFEMNENYGTTETLLVAMNSHIVRDLVTDYRLIDVPELGYYVSDRPHPRGELLVKSANMMTGYYKQPELTAEMYDGDGYYRTGDIMAEIGPDRIAFVDRRNNVLKLSQGEFVAISHLEAVYSGGHPLIHQVYLFGSGERSYLLGVVVPNREAVDQAGIGGDETLLRRAVRGALNEVARAASLAPYEIPRDFFLEEEPFSVANGLITGLGKHARAGLRAKYGDRLDALYDSIETKRVDDLRRLRESAASAPALDTVLAAIASTLGVGLGDVSAEAAFADLGGDSLSALSVSLLLEELFGVEVPVGTINNPAGTLGRLAVQIERMRAGDAVRPTAASVHGADGVLIRATDLTLDRFIDVETLAAAASLDAESPREVRTVLVTGANGYLGRFLCLEWLERLAPIGGKVISIARGGDGTDARRRIEEAFDSGDDELAHRFGTLANGHLEVLAGDLAESRLGLSENDWRRLCEEVDLIVHPAALVNHLLPYGQLFGPNVVGTAELIRLAITSRIKPFNNVSTVAVAMLADGNKVEEDEDIRAACPMRSLDSGSYANGYASTKWAAEVLLREANDRFDLPVVNFRADMILAHSRFRGQINKPDMFTRWLLSMLATGLAPGSFNIEGREGRDHYDGLPVDFVSGAMASLGFQHRDGYHDYHVVNPHDDGLSFDQFVDWLIDAGHEIERVASYDEWYRRFEMALRALPENERQRSSYPLLADQFGSPTPACRGSVVPARALPSRVKDLGLAAYGDIPGMSPGYLGKMVDDLRALGLATES